MLQGMETMPVTVCTVQRNQGQHCGRNLYLCGLAFFFFFSLLLLSNMALLYSYSLFNKDMWKWTSGKY